MEITKLLKKDHDQVRAMFKAFEKLGDKAFGEKEELAARICKELEIHTRIEEELFYPELETPTETADLIREAYAEHQQAKKLIAEIKRMRVDADDFDAKMKVLREDIEHRADEEEDELLPAAKDVLDDDEREMMGEEAEEMKQRLQGALGEEEGPRPAL